MVASEQNQIVVEKVTAVQDVNNSPELTHVNNIKVSSPGHYRIKVLAKNAFGQLTTESCLSVQVIQVDELSITNANRTESSCSSIKMLMPQGSQTMYQSFAKNFSIPLETDCTLDLVSNTQVFRMSGGHEYGSMIPTGMQLCNIYLIHQFSLNQSASIDLLVPPSRLGMGNYIARIELTLKDYQPGVYTIIDLPFEVTPSPLQANFGADEATLMENEPLFVDFSQSGDPDVGLEDSTDIQFDIFVSKSDQGPKNMSYKEIMSSSQLIYADTNYATKLYEFNQSCMFVNRTLEVRVGFRMVSLLSDFLFENNVPYYFYLFVHKLTRDEPGRSSMRVIASPGNMSMDDAIDRIEDLLSKGDKTAALNAINSVSRVLNKQGNDSDISSEGRARVRTRVVGILDNVSSSLDNFNQLQNTGSALKSITQSRGEVTDDARQGAGRALANVGNATKSFASQPIHALTDVAGEVVNAVGNVLPTPEEQAKSENTLFDGKLPVINGSVVNASIFTTIAPSTPWLPSLSTVLPNDVFTTIVEMAHTESPEIIRRIAREAAEGSITTTPAAMITTTVAMPQTVTWETVREFATTMAPDYNRTDEYNLASNISNVTDSAEMLALKDALAALGENAGPGRRTILKCIECGLPPDFSIEKEIALLSRDGSFFTRREITLIEACAIYRGIDLRCLFFYEDPSELRQLYRSCRAEEEAILAAKRARDKLLTLNTIGSIDSLSGVLLSKQEAGDSGVNLENSQLSLKLVKVNASNTTGSSPHALSSPTGGVKVPQVAVGNSSDNTSVGMQFLATASNPFSYSDSAKAIKSGVVTLSYSNPDGSPKEVSNTSEPIDIRTAGKPELAPPSSNFTVWAPVAEVSELPMAYHRIQINSNDSSLHIVLRPMDEITFFQVFVAYKYFPNETLYNFTQIIPTTDNVTLAEAKDEQARDELKFTVFVPPELTRFNGTYYVGIKVTGVRVEIPFVARNYTYNMRMFTSGCRFWDPEKDEWSTMGCTVGPQTTIYETQCLCNHLTSFGTDFMTPPNAIDFNTVWSKFDAKNATVYSVMLVLIILYVILGVFLHQADKNDMNKWEPRPLKDNLPTDRYFYQVSIFTGWKSQAETQSKVRMIVVGAKGDTGVRCVQPARQSKTFVFRNGTINHFILSTEQPLGQLSYLRIWHDNSGKGRYKSWFLEQIQISDLQTERKYYFLVDRWLAVDRDDGAVERVCPVASLQDLITFRYLFASDIRRRFSDEHIWFSCVSRPTRSLFTRVQRLTVCLSMLFTTMLANAMFYQNEDEAIAASRTDDGGVAARNTVRFGPITISLREVWVSVVSSLMIVPIHAIAIFIFKNRLPSKSTARVAQEGVSTVSKRTPKWKPVEENVIDNFEDGDAIRSRRQGVRGFFNRTGKKLNTFFGRKDAAETYESEESRQHKRIFKKKGKKQFLLPAKAMYVAYFFMGLCIVVSTFFLLLYSMSWGIEKSNAWMVSFVLSFFSSSIVVEPIKIIAIVVLLSCLFKKPKRNKEETHQIDATKNVVEKWIVENKGKVRVWGTSTTASY